MDLGSRLVVEQREVVERTLELFEGSAIPLADAYLAGYALVRGESFGDPGLPAVVSFDRHFDRHGPATSHRPN